MREPGTVMGYPPRVMPSPPKPDDNSRGPGRAADADADWQALVDARQQLWQLEFSALLLGRRFVALCHALGLDPLALPPTRREAIDAAMGWPLPGQPADALDSVDLVQQRLQALLLLPLH